LTSKTGQKLKIWIDSARPKTLPAAIAPVVMGAAMAIAQGPIDGWVLAIILFCALCIQIGTNYANDYFDFVKGTDTHERVGPTRATAAGLVTPRQMLVATGIVFGGSVVGGLYLVWQGGWPILLIGLLSIACGILYTAGPYPLGYVGLGDFFVLVFFGLIPVAGTYYLLAGHWHAHTWLAGLGPGLLSTAILAVNNYRDRTTDREAGKRTLVVRFGDGFGAGEYAFALIVALHIPVLLVILTGSHFGVFITLLALVPGIRLIATFVSNHDPNVFNELLARTGKLLVLYSVLFSVGWNL
jgi:1,4-dihydroxy-2-naphthoate octaprenyltransferase